jgi:hypothetical protein
MAEEVTGAMKFRPFSLRCECGLMPARIKQVGLSAEHQLVIHWWCLRCKKAVYVVKDLCECWEDSPAPEELANLENPEADLNRRRDDEKFLHSLGIRLLPDEQA